MCTMEKMEAAYKIIDSCDSNLSTLLGTYARKLVNEEDVADIRTNIESEKVKRGKAIRELVSAAEVELEGFDLTLPDISKLSIDELGDIIVDYKGIIKYTDRIIEESTDITNPKNVKFIKLNYTCSSHLGCLTSEYRKKLASVNDEELDKLLQGMRNSYPGSF